MITLPAQPDFPQRFLALTELTGNQCWLCIGFALTLLLVDEEVKFFMRRSYK